MQTAVHKAKWFMPLFSLALGGLVITLCMWEWAHGRDGTPYAPLGAITGVTYIAAVVMLRLRG